MKLIVFVILDLKFCQVVVWAFSAFRSPTSNRILTFEVVISFLLHLKITVIVNRAHLVQQLHIIIPSLCLCKLLAERDRTHIVLRQGYA